MMVDCDDYGFFWVSQQFQSGPTLKWTIMLAVLEWFFP
jgi:hypothetical protein